MMQFYLVKFVPTKHYAQIIDPKGTPRIICFNTIDTSHKCVEQLCMYRSKYGKWPQVDLTREVATVKVDNFFKKRTPTELLQYFDEEEMSETQLEGLARTYNVQLFYCTNFKIFSKNNNAATLTISGNEIEIPEDYNTFRGQLEMTYRFR